MNLQPRPKATMVYRRCARLVAMLPATSEQIAEALDLCEQTTGVWLRELRALGVIAPISYVQRKGRMYGPGDGKRRNIQQYDKPASGIYRFADALDALKTRRTVADLAQAIDVHPRVASEIVLALKANKLIRVCGWITNKNTAAPIYDRLPVSDVPKPERMTKQQTNARYWSKYSARNGAQLGAE